MWILWAIAFAIAFLLFGFRSKGNGESALRPPPGNLIIFDTETTGKPIDFNVSYSTPGNWPRLVQIAWIKIAPNGKEINRASYIVCPSDFKIPEEATKIHGISHQQACNLGIKIDDVVNRFNDDLMDCRYLVAHNIAFDFNVIGAEMFRLGRLEQLKAKEQICTMRLSTNYCKLIGSYGQYKWPKLSELYRTLFMKEVIERHDALYDAEICLLCFKELFNRQVIRF
jgi:DNA polymerase III epsilon subunit-like protein